MFFFCCLVFFFLLYVEFTCCPWSDKSLFFYPQPIELPFDHVHSQCVLFLFCFSLFFLCLSLSWAFFFYFLLTVCPFSPFDLLSVGKLYVMCLGIFFAPHTFSTPVAFLFVPFPAPFFSDTDFLAIHRPSYPSLLVFEDVFFLIPSLLVFMASYVMVLRALPTFFSVDN